jgi:hypothetical protein
MAVMTMAAIAAKHRTLEWKKKVRGYNSTDAEFKRVLVKWGNTPRVLEKFLKVVAERAVEDCRSCKKSSKPTPQPSRR